MKTIQIEGTDLRVSNIIMGCMRINALSKKEAAALIGTAMDLGINLFDHADIYGGGECESLFADAVDMCPAVREKMVLQSKCSIRNGYFDFSKETILEATDGILRRLRRTTLTSCCSTAPIRSWSRRRSPRRLTSCMTRAKSATSASPTKTPCRLSCCRSTAVTS